MSAPACGSAAQSHPVPSQPVDYFGNRVWGCPVSICCCRRIDTSSIKCFWRDKLWGGKKANQQRRESMHSAFSGTADLSPLSQAHKISATRNTFCHLWPFGYWLLLLIWKQFVQLIRVLLACFVFAHSNCRKITLGLTHLNEFNW